VVPAFSIAGVRPLRELRRHAIRGPYRLAVLVHGVDVQVAMGISRFDSVTLPEMLTGFAASKCGATVMRGARAAAAKPRSRRRQLR
jgi:hypothetical protein